MTTAAERYRILTVAEAAALLDQIGLPHGIPVTYNGGRSFVVTVQPLDAWRLLKSGERKRTPIGFDGVKGRIERKHGELAKWEVTGEGEVTIHFRVLRAGL